MSDKVLEILTAPTEEPPKWRYCRSWPRTAFSEEAKFAMDVAKLVAAFSIKEGKVEAPLTPAQVAERAVAITENLFAAMKERGWTELVPTIEQLDLGNGAPMGFTKDAA